MEPYMFGCCSDGSIRLYHSMTEVFVIHEMIPTDKCIGLLRGITEMEEGVVQIFFIENNRISSKTYMIPHDAWFVPATRFIPPDTYKLVARYLERDDVDTSPPVYKWKRKSIEVREDGGGKCV